MSDDVTVRDLVAILRYVLDGRGFANYDAQIESLDYANAFIGKQTQEQVVLCARVRRHAEISEFEITIRRKR
jgi:hypothetical protein